MDADPDGLGRRVRVELFKRFGYFPTESSEHSAEYVPWFLHHDDQVERFRSQIDEYVRRSDENLAEFEALKVRLDAGEDVEVELNSELASQIVRAVETGVTREVYGNVRNDGLIEGLPADACVEVPCVADKNGVLPTRIGAMPAADPGAQSDVRERGGAHRARRAGATPRPGLRRRAAGPQHRRPR